MANAKYTISIHSKDSDLIQYVEDQRRKTGLSVYIRNLIRRDMENQENLKLELIYEYVLKRINEEGHMKGLAAEKVADFIDDADKDIIKDLF